MRNPLWLLVRDLVQAGCVVLFPFYCELPAGVFVFWVTNSLWSLAQGAAVRRTATHRALRGLAPTAPAAATGSRAIEGLVDLPIRAAEMPEAANS